MLIINKSSNFIRIHGNALRRIDACVPGSPHDLVSADWFPGCLAIIRSGLARIGSPDQEGAGSARSPSRQPVPAGVRRPGIEIVTATEHVDLAPLNSGQLGAEIATLLLLAIRFMVRCPQTGIPSKG